MNRYKTLLTTILISILCSVSNNTYGCDPLDIEIQGSFYKYIPRGSSIDITAEVVSGPSVIESGWTWNIPGGLSHGTITQGSGSSTVPNVCSDTFARYYISVIGNAGEGNTDSASCYLFNFGGSIWTNPSYTFYQTSMYIYHRVRPDDYWAADSVSIEIKDDTNATIKNMNGLYRYSGVTVGNWWDGKDNSGSWAEPGTYSAILTVTKGEATYTSEPCYFSIIRPVITVGIGDPVVSNVCSGLNVDTIVFQLNGVVINNEYLAIEPFYITIDEESILNELEITYQPSSYELIIPGENTITVDIDDNVDNHMETLIETFYLP